MIEKIDGLPEQFLQAYPHKERPRESHLFGVTEILYCSRKSFLSRVIPAAGTIDFETRRRFSRGHLAESLFFGPEHNPMYLTGIDRLKGMEGHTDHAIFGKDKKIKEIVEFKSVKRLWYKSPNGKTYYSLKYARAGTDRSDWSKINRNYNDSHMDQLMLYMLLSDAKRGYLIYQEMSTDDNHTWTLTSDDISQEFKDKMADRLDYLRDCYKVGEVPIKNSMYPWECGLCSFNKSGVCGLCDVNGFNINKMLLELYKAGNPDIDFLTITDKYLGRYGVEPGKQVMFINGAKIEDKKESVDEVETSL